MYKAAAGPHRDAPPGLLPLGLARFERLTNLYIKFPPLDFPSGLPPEWRRRGAFPALRE